MAASATPVSIPVPSGLSAFDTPSLIFSEASAQSSSPPSFDPLATPRDVPESIPRTRSGKMAPTVAAAAKRGRSSTPSAPLPEQITPVLSRASMARADLPPASATNVLAQAQAAGITTEQFEQARQQMFQFLRNPAHNANGLSAASSSTSRQFSPALTSTEFGSVSPAVASTATFPDLSFQMEDLKPEVAITIQRSDSAPPAPLKEAPRRYSLDAVLERSKSVPEGLLHAQIDEEEDDEDEEMDIKPPPPPFAVPVGATPRQAAPFATNGAVQPSPSEVMSTPYAKSGMMDRFVTDRSATKAHEEGEGETTVFPGSRQNRTPSPGPTPNNRVAPDASVTMTPPQVKKSNPGALFSPDVAKLLSSELDELRAQSKQREKHRRTASRPVDAIMEVDEDDDDDYEEPAPTRRNGKKRAREPSAVENDLKRSRRGPNPNAAVEEEGGSPSPSNGSGPLRAPSFCDSSPAVSERTYQSAHSAHRQQSYYSSALPVAHNTDYQLDGPPSSPVSSHYSYNDQQVARARSSPGPSHRYQATPHERNVMTSVPQAARRQANTPRFDATPSQYGNSKPPWSYAALIGQAIFSADNLKISLADIYAYIMHCYPYYKKEDAGWQNSIRHNLSLNECFIKTARGADNPGKGCLWTIKAGTEDQFADGGFTKKGAAKKANKGRGGGAVSTGASGPSAAAKFDPSGLLRSAALAKVLPAANAVAVQRSNSNVSHVSVMGAPEGSPAMPSPVAMPLAAMPSSSSSDTVTSLSFDEDTRIDTKPGLAPPYLMTESRSSPGPRLSEAAEIQDRNAATSPALASPPTSVYQRSNQPFRPLPRTRTITSEHRATALMSSPEIGGIMPAHPFEPSIRESATRHMRASVPPGARLFSDDEDEVRPPRIEEEEEDDSRNSSRVLGVGTSDVHRSPVSSVRGGARGMGNGSDEHVKRETSPRSKKVQLPSIAALAGEEAQDTFKTPARTVSSASKLPSTSRPLQSLGPLQAAMSSPGRFSTPARGGGRSSDPNWHAYGEGSELEAELERFGSDDVVHASGGSTYEARRYFPSPGGPALGRPPMTPW